MIICYGNLEGQYYSQWRIDDLVKLAETINKAKPTIETFMCWHDEREDYHYLSWFDGEDNYVVRFYKVFVLIKNGDEDNKITFGHNFDRIVDLFRSK